MRKFVLTLREVEMDDYMKPLRYRGKEDSVVFLEQQLQQEGKQAVYGDVLGYLQRSFERMLQCFKTRHISKNIILEENNNESL